MRKVVNIIHLLALALFIGCVAGEGGKKKADCATGQEFDSVSRSCKGAIVLPDAPTPLTKSVSILEDSGYNAITLEYQDGENDFATSCSVSSGSSQGYIKSLDLQGLRIISNNDIVDPSNTYVTISQALIPTAVPAVNLNLGIMREIEIVLPSIGSATSSTIASLINVPPVSNYVQAAILANQVMVPQTGAFPLDEVECGCTGGLCRVGITPVEDFNGTTEFSYTLTDKDGTSASQIVRLNITSVNDAPEVTLITGRTVNATEKYDHDPLCSYSAMGNLLSDTFDACHGVPVQAIVTANDTRDGDPTSFNLSWFVDSPAVHGTVILDPLTATYTYTTTKEEATDSFSVYAVDSQGGRSPSVTITVNITNVDDPPIGTLSSLSNFNEDGSAGVVTLTYTDEEDAENDSATRCAITQASKVYPDGGCSCNGSGVCTAIINGLPNQNGTASFSYKIYDASVKEPEAKLVEFSINAIADDPIVFPSVVTDNSIQGDESATFIPADYSFTLNGASDDDGNVITTYTLVSGPSHGSIDGCLGSGASGLNCTYTPNDGNLADSTALDKEVGAGSDLAQVGLGAFGTFYAKTLGTSYNGFEIEFKNMRNSDESINTLYSANALAFTQGPGKVVFIVQSGMTTPAHISAAISANPSVEKLLFFEEGAGVVGGAQVGSFLLAGGVATIDQFTMRATDLTGASTDQVVHISINPVDDRPTICEYSSYAETDVCGLNGCIGNFSPNTITPDQDGLIFYSTLTGSCFKSSAGEWEPVESFVASRTINELNPIVIDNIKVDEGGGASEDAESITITNIDSSDENLVPLGNIEIFYDDFSSGDTGDATPFALSGSGPVSADSLNMRVVITPQTINPADDEKSSEIEITVQDSTGRSTEVTFTVSVQKVSATHGGWISFGATGPKVDGLGLVNEDRLVCPYSLDLCEGGKKCTGTSTPVNNASADPDNANAIYMQDNGTTRTCYRQKRNQLQNIAFIGKTANPVTINYDPALGSNIQVSGNTISILVVDDTTTTDTIISRINGNASASALVKAINLKTGEDQDSPATVTVNALGNSNWESFETYCNATPAALEPACGVAGVDSCVGTQSPRGLIAPTKRDSRYWDEQANVCYRSTGTTVNSWETYDAPAEVSLSWNQFVVNGSASISEYRVFRRLASDEFDFSKPINRNTITGNSTTYTYVDNAQNSVTPPAPGTVYYYVVRPVVNGVLTSTAAETGTNAVGIVRIMAPPKNMAFAHRWMINKRVCSQMNRSSDPTNNYRCEYKGPGDTLVSGTSYYDFGRDLLIDRFEAGCPYSPAPACPGTFDNSCIGVSNPNGSITPSAAHKVYYSRSEGKCYYNATGGINTWVEWNNLTTVQIATYFANYEPDTTNLDATNPQFDSNNDKQYHRSSLPPLTNINQANANLFCTGLEDIQHEELLGVSRDLSHRMPSRKDQIVYSMWDQDTLNDSAIAVTETGLSLNSSSKCNSSGASGLENGYVDFDKPDSNDFYSLPGTDASGIRSLTTGSNETANCTSAFGVQDAVGNVSEWTTNGFSCPLLSQCVTNENLVIQGVEFVRVRPTTNGLAIGVIFERGTLGQPVAVLTSGTARIIRVDLNELTTENVNNVVSEVNGFAAASNLVTARVVGTGTDPVAVFGNTAFMGIELTGTDDQMMISEDTSDNYGYWTLDGLRGPCVDSDSDLICDENISSWAIEDERFSAGRFLTPLGLPAHVSSVTNFTTDYDLFEIGPTSGITSLRLHDDTVTFNSRVIASEPTGCGGLSAGGSYMSGNGSGVWNLEAHPCSEGFGVLTLQDVTFRANDAQDLNFTIRYIDDAGVNPMVEVSGNTVIVDLQELPAATPENIVIAVNNFVNAGPVPSLNISAFVSGDPLTLQAAFATPVSFTDLRDDAVSKRVDVGFRCVLEVPYSDTPSGGGTAYDE